MKHKYTESEHKFLRDFVPGHTYKEIVDAYNARFEQPITPARLKSYIGNHKLNTGMSGRFEKGRVPHNKGQKGLCYKGCEKTWFRKGHMPANVKPLGYERITKDGYVEVKVKMRPSHPGCDDNFIAKHRLVWEAVNGPIPKGHKLIFLDGDKKNCEIKNLALVTEAEHLELTRRGLRTKHSDLTRTGILITKAGIAVRKAKE